MKRVGTHAVAARIAITIIIVVTEAARWSIPAALAQGPTPSPPPAAAAPAAPTAMPTAPLRGIWISPPSSTNVIPGVMRTIRRSGLDTVVLPVFYDGRVVYPSRVFPQHDLYYGTDPAALFVQETHRRNMRAFAAVDLLYWQSSDNPSPAVANHGQWLERTPEGRVIGDVVGRAGAFVSPCETRVKSLLTELASELASKYDFDGLVLDYARWSRVDFLGYADADRKLYLAEQQTDPLDVDLLGYATPENMISSLVSWQEKQITAVAEATAQAFRRGEPQGMVIAVVEGGYYADRVASPVRQDWRSWLSRGWLEAVAPRQLAYADPVAVSAQLQAMAAMPNPAVVALIRRSNALPALPQMAVATQLGLRGFILWGRDSLDQRRAILTELGAR
jgi:uncharacterized lipoprotein YddW (UPF0748 family)